MGEYPIPDRFPKTFWKPKSEKGVDPQANPLVSGPKTALRPDQLPSEASMSRPVMPPVVYMCIPVLTRLS